MLSKLFPMTEGEQEKAASCMNIARELANKSLYRFTGLLDDNEAEDAAFNGLMMAARAYDETKGNFSAFARTKIKWGLFDAARKKLRRNKRMPIISLDSGSDGGFMMSTIQARGVDADTRIMLDQAIDGLDPRQRRAIRMELEGHTLREIGEEMGFTKEYARQLTNRAKRGIRQKISREDAAL